MWRQPRDQGAWARFLALPLHACGITGKSLNLSRSSVPLAAGTFYRSVPTRPSGQRQPLRIWQCSAWHRGARPVP